MPGALPLLVVAAVAAVAVAWASGVSNGLTGLRSLVGEAWRQVGEELDGRWALVPDLVGKVRTLAPDLRGSVQAVLAAHAAVALEAGRPHHGAAGGSVRGRWVAEQALTVELGRMFALVEGHPLLVADQDFLLLRQELRENEDRIAAGRRRYNDAAAALNARIARYPARLVARVFGVGPAEPFDGRGATSSPRRASLA